MKIGTKFEALRGTNSGDVTVGQTYEIVGFNHDGDEYFIDDVGDKNYAVAFNGNLYPDGYRVVE